VPSCAWRSAVLSFRLSGCQTISAGATASDARTYLVLFYRRPQTPGKQIGDRSSPPRVALALAGLQHFLFSALRLFCAFSAPSLRLLCAFFPPLPAGAVGASRVLHFGYSGPTRTDYPRPISRLYLTFSHSQPERRAVADCRTTAASGSGDMPAHRLSPSCCRCAILFEVAPASLPAWRLARGRWRVCGPSCFSSGLSRGCPVATRPLP
jgi:hypothetical protein